MKRARARAFQLYHIRRASKHKHKHKPDSKNERSDREPLAAFGSHASRQANRIGRFLDRAEPSRVEAKRNSNSNSPTSRLQHPSKPVELEQFAVWLTDWLADWLADSPAVANKGLARLWGIRWRDSSKLGARFCHSSEATLINFCRFAIPTLARASLRAFATKPQKADCSH